MGLVVAAVLAHWLPQLPGPTSRDQSAATPGSYACRTWRHTVNTDLQTLLRRLVDLALSIVSRQSQRARHSASTYWIVENEAARRWNPNSSICRAALISMGVPLAKYQCAGAFPSARRAFASCARPAARPGNWCTETQAHDASHYLWGVPNRR